MWSCDVMVLRGKQLFAHLIFPHVSYLFIPRAQLLEGWLVLIQGYFTLVSFLLFKSIFSDNFLCYLYEHPIINLLTKRIRLNLVLKLSYLNSNFALTLTYLNTAFNSPALGTRGFYLRPEKSFIVLGQRSKTWNVKPPQNPFGVDCLNLPC